MDRTLCLINFTLSRITSILLFYIINTYRYMAYHKILIFVGFLESKFTRIHVMKNVAAIQDSHKGVTPHLWLNSSDDLSWPPVCASAEKINCMFAKQIINIDRLFDERILVKNYDSASDRRERWQNTPISYEQKRTQLFQAFRG